ncbi:unnamed protein product [Phytophthora fragariaefolia]|uniref:Unnamed protein product n=1 Tax=Phytophthora fragariaefolia TaxID=1490495 RepID=A0A9W7CTW3_9STRA|nr:unnamed protein product [Phytophthora fragariaefolia]
MFQHDSSMIVMSGLPTPMSVEPMQSGQGSTVTHATKTRTDVTVSIDRVRRVEELTFLPTTATSIVNGRSLKLGSPPTETGLVPIWLPQLASPPVDADCVYAFVGESKWLTTQRREDANEMKTMEIEKARNGSIGGGDERMYDEWNGDSSEGWVSMDVVLGTDFMIPAGVRLGLFHATAQLLNEIEIPLIKTQRMVDTREEAPHVPDGPIEVLTIPRHVSRDDRPMRQLPTNETHVLWVQRTKEFIPKVVEFRRGPTASTSDKYLGPTSHVPRGDLPRAEGYVQLGSGSCAFTRPRDADVAAASAAANFREQFLGALGDELVVFPIAAETTRGPFVVLGFANVTDKFGLVDCGASNNFVRLQSLARLDFEEVELPRSLLEVRLATGVVVRTEKKFVDGSYVL